MISDERIERAAEAMLADDPVVLTMMTWKELKETARAALTADAAEIAAAEIRGLEMAKEIAIRRAIRNDCCVKREDEAAEIADDILARIAELKAKPEPTGCK